MKKTYILIGALVLAGAIALVIYINQKPSKPSGSDSTPSEQVKSESPKEPAMHPQRDANAPRQPQPSLSAEQEAQKQKTVNEFVARSQVDKDFEKAADMLKGMLEHLRPDEQKTMQKFIDKLSGPEIMDEYKKMLAETFSEPELERLSQIYGDKEIVLFQEAGRKAATPEGQKEIEKHLRSFDINKLPADRKEALMSLAANQMKTFEGAMPDMTPTQKKDYESFQVQMRESLVGQFDAALKDRSTDQLKHLESLTGDKIFELEQQTRAKLLFQQMLMAEQAIMD